MCAWPYCSSPCCCFLIYTVNRYMLRRRQKEFAVQLLLGMEQRSVAWLFFAETLLMGALSVGMGIGLGVICSQWITAMLYTDYGQAYHFVWTLFRIRSCGRLDTLRSVFV